MKSSRPVNQFTAAVALVIGIGNLSLATGDIQIPGIALGTITTVVVYHASSTAERLRG